MESKSSLRHSQSISGFGLEPHKPRKHTHTLLLKTHSNYNLPNYTKKLKQTNDYAPYTVLFSAYFVSYQRSHMKIC